MIYKVYAVESKAVDRAAGIYEVMISTEAVDRQGDIVRATGGLFDNYLKNPVVLLSHDYSDLPVGKTLELSVVPGVGIRAKFQFPPEGLYEKADTTRKLWDAGFLNAASIGFNPIKSVGLDQSRSWGAQEFTEWELLEWSIVTVPANQDALRLALDGINTTLEKRGRVLSAGNEKKLREAAQSINDVLSQLGGDDPEAEPDKDTEYQEAKGTDTAEQPSHDALPAEVLAQLHKFFEAIEA